MSFLDMPYPGPGPEERKWTSRLRFKVSGHWPPSVVDERLRIADRHSAEMRVAAERQFREAKNTDG